VEQPSHINILFLTLISQVFKNYNHTHLSLS